MIHEGQGGKSASFSPPTVSICRTSVGFVGPKSLCGVSLEHPLAFQSVRLTKIHFRTGRRGGSV